MTDGQGHDCPKCREQIEPGEMLSAGWARRCSNDAIWERAKAALATLKLHGLRCPKCGLLELYARMAMARLKSLGFAIATPGSYRD